MIHVSSEHITLAEILAEPLIIQNWRLCGLPSDTVSISNAVIMKYSLKNPLLVDPQKQATNWLKTMHAKDRSLKVTKCSHKNFLQHIEEAIVHGQTILIEDV